MFPPRMRQQFPFNNRNFPMGMGNNPMGFNPFEYQFQQMQEDNPFARDFFMPQLQQQALAQQQPTQAQQGQPAPGQMPQEPSMRHLHPFDEFIRDGNGNIDFQKIGNGVSQVMGLVNQAAPMMRMFGGFFR